MAIDGLAVSDFHSLSKLKAEAQADAKKALPTVAKQFEAVFIQAMLKSMRLSQHFVDDSSPFRGKFQEDFQEMLDGQYASNIANGRGIGLAALLTKQMDRLTPGANAEAQNPVEFAPRQFSGTPTSLVPPSAPMATPSVEKESTNPEKAASIDDFVKSIWPYARQAASLIGLDPKILIAQAALETGWGRHIIKDGNGESSHNLFNIKAGGNSAAVKVNTTEFIANTPVKMSASFKKYSSPAHSFHDYISLIKGDSRYESALANVNNPQRYLSELHQAGYATDPDYAHKILSIYNGDELQQALQRNGCM